MDFERVRKVEEFQEEFVGFITQPLVVMSIIGFFLALPVINGLSMQWAVNLAGGGPVGFLRGCGAAGAAAAAGGIAHAVMAVLFGDTPGWVLAAYSTVAGIAAIALVARCNPLSAGLAYLLHAIMASLGTATAAAALIAGLYLASSQNLIEPLEAAPSQAQWDALATRWGSGETAAGGLPSNPTAGASVWASGDRSPTRDEPQPSSASGTPGARGRSDHSADVSPRRETSGRRPTPQAEYEPPATHRGVRTNPFVTD